MSTHTNTIEKHLEQIDEIANAIRDFQTETIATKMQIVLDTIRTELDRQAKQTSTITDGDLKEIKTMLLNDIEGRLVHHHKPDRKLSDMIDKTARLVDKLRDKAKQTEQHLTQIVDIANTINGSSLQVDKIIAICEHARLIAEVKTQSQGAE